MVWRPKKFFFNFLAAATVGLILFFLLKNLFLNWREIRDYPFSFNYCLLAWSAVFWSAGFFILARTWNRIFQTVSKTRKFSDFSAFRIYLAGELSRYLPGKIWPVVGKVYLGAKAGFSRRKLLTASLLDSLLALAATSLGGLVFFLFGFSGFFNYYYFGLSLAVVLIALLFSRPKFFYIGVNFFFRRLNRAVIPPEDFFSGGDVVKFFSWYFLAFFLRGLGFFFLLKAVVPIPWDFWPAAVGIFGLATALGVAAFFAPGGLGVKEGIAAGLLAGIIPFSPAVAVSFLTRFWQLAIQLGLFGILELFRRRKKSFGPAGQTLCPACGRNQAGFYFSKQGYDYFSCPDCRLIFLSPSPNLTSIANFYRREYFGSKSGSLDSAYADYEADKKAMDKFYSRILDRLKSKISGDYPRLFDIGTASGYFLELATAKGFQAEGLEINSEIAAAGRRRGRMVFPGVLGDLPESWLTERTGCYQIITLWDTLEHFPNLAIAFRELEILLAPGGILAVTTPNAGSFWARLFGRRWHSYVPPEHLVFFNQDNLKDFLSSRGYQVLAIEPVYKKFTFPYIFNMLYRWQKLKIWDILARRLATVSFFQTFALTIPLGDNLLVIARKRLK